MTIQDHVHLSSSLGGAPENAPDQAYSVNRRSPKPYVILSPRRGLTGRLFTHILTDAGGPVQFEDFILRLTLTAAELATLQGELGRQVYFVDHDHPDDGEDHTASVQTMLVQEISDIEPFTTALERFYATVTLVDDHTVT